MYISLLLFSFSVNLGTHFLSFSFFFSFFLDAAKSDYFFFVPVDIYTLLNMKRAAQEIILANSCNEFEKTKK